MTTSASAPPSFHHESLWVKAKLFINFAMEDTTIRTFDERALWASLSLELLAKAALSKASPALIAEPTEEGRNLLVAAGLVPSSKTFLSVRAKTIFARCSIAFRPFDHETAMKISAARNEYLHGGSAQFAPIPEHAWWPSFWGQASILINALDRDMSDFVGELRSASVETHLAQNKKNIEDRSNMRVERAKQLWTQATAGTLNASVFDEWDARRRALPNRLERVSEIREVCPACGHSDKTWLTGELVEDTDVQYERISEDDFDVIVTLTVATDYFACETCGLELDEWDLIEATGLPAAFPTEGEASDVFESEYGND